METENNNYDVSETPIKDKSMLGTHGKKLCDNIDVYWLTPVTGDDDTAGKTTHCVQTAENYVILHFVSQNRIY